ncbi:MAG: NUDIX hydrolase [Bacteroidales bacterium]|nr:NUDIX hydrolase [Bacteroidales bacterium]
MEQIENGPYSYKYPRPSVTTDCVVFGYDSDGLRILLIERGIEPFKGKWALPGGFMQMNETLEECARRELQEETGLKLEYLEQFFSFSDVNRDPRGRVVTVAFLALVKTQDVVGGDDATRAVWFSLSNMPPLAFDHEEIYRMALAKLRERIYFEPVGFDLLPTEFTMTELQHLYEEILDTKFDRRNFYKKMTSSQIVETVDEPMREITNLSDTLSGVEDALCDSFMEQKAKKTVAGRIPFKYIFNRKRYEELKKDGGKLEF